MRHFESFINIVRLRDFHFWSFRSFLATFPWICILWLWIINWLKIAHVGNNKGDLFMKLTEKILKEFWIICWSQWKWKNLPKNAIFRIFPLIYSWDIENKMRLGLAVFLKKIGSYLTLPNFFWISYGLVFTEPWRPLSYFFNAFVAIPIWTDGSINVSVLHCIHSGWKSRKNVSF